jgi:hypothetical protein
MIVEIDDDMSGKGPMYLVKKLTEFLSHETMKEDTVKAQILEIYLEDNKNVRKILINNLKLDELL